MNAPIPQSVVQQVTAQDLKALPLIQKWVSFASVSRDSNLPLIDWTQAYLESLGLECHRTYDDTRQKANHNPNKRKKESSGDLPTDRRLV